MQNISHLVVRLSKHDTEVLHGGVYKRKLHTVNDILCPIIVFTNEPRGYNVENR
ncbi:uncharacterized protein PHALS_00929 [Plasmopara halstedii]|uniref:Uncharacterized protein n=1 Tax=Plasmopara halstedii TaxID=4781 RepID=A0A0P1AUK5_PLAHL|nr:uncharacterized protein PHALS_00929 [Plasmopara halstedii]CEG44578.1 hypothetical protein PHALS_00929 [Plasmopara halstedii]|eukprot:XP_024580947.1 hypothetical protein PHALS_00929 [Plasmopara halstedii]